MTTQKQIDWELIAYHLQQLPIAFSFCRTELRDLTAELLELKETHCTGSEHWRDANDDSLKPKLYVIHHTGIACPIHGQPEPGKRIRTYIGSNKDKIHEAQVAIARGRLYRETMTKLRRRHAALESASYTIRQVFWNLELDTPSLPSNEETKENHD